MKRILVPIDFSDVSKYAAEFAVGMAEKTQAEIILLHSIHFNYFNDFPHATGINLESMIDDVKESVENNMKKFVDALNTSASVEIKISRLHLLEAVRDTIKDEDVGLVVLGTAGSSGWTEFLIGSNTERIVRWADCPVISVPVKTSFNEIKKILVPIDLTEVQEEFMNKLSILQKMFSAHIDFLWVKTPHNIENSQKATAEFNEVLKSHNIKNSSFTIAHNVFPSDGIQEQAKELNSDMIAMATHSRRGLSHWLSGSMTEDTVNHVKLPVWSFKMQKDGKNIGLKSVENASGKAEYKKIELLAE